MKIARSMFQPHEHYMDHWAWTVHFEAELDRRQFVEHIERAEHQTLTIACRFEMHGVREVSRSEVTGAADGAWGLAYHPGRYIVSWLVIGSTYIQVIHMDPYAIEATELATLDQQLLERLIMSGARVLRWDVRSVHHASDYAPVVHAGDSGLDSLLNRVGGLGPLRG